MRKGLGIFSLDRGSPISSQASRRAIWKGVSVRASALPPGNAACPISHYPHQLVYG
jgi:hypothetical protein